MAISYSQLNAKQKQGANHVFGPMLVLAGAGTGKTSVIVHRISRLISTGQAKPTEIRAFTFTHKAAREIRSRVGRSSAGIGATRLNASTFHGYCYQLLRESGAEFQLLDQCELWAFLRQHVAELPLDRFLRAANPGRFLRDLLTFFDRCSDELVDAKRYSDYIARVVASELPAPRVAKKKQAELMEQGEVLDRCREIAAIFSTVEEMLNRHRLLTFGALISRATALLKSDVDLLKRERQSARFLLIDEFQDSNHAQIELARTLAGDEQNVFAVGDPDQAIYHFRGASSAAFTEFVNTFSRLERKNILNLAENQRSSQNILDCGFAAIRQNPPLAQPGSRLEFDRERLVSARDRETLRSGNSLLFGAEPVDVVPYRHYAEEAADVAERILEVHHSGARWKDCAVLFRSHSNAEALAEELGSRAIPFDVQDTDLFETDTIRDLLALLRCSLSPKDDVALFRLALGGDSGLDADDLYPKLSSAERGTHAATVFEQVRGGPDLLRHLQTFAEEHQVTKADLVTVIHAAAHALGIEQTSVELTRFSDFAASWREKRIAASGLLPEFLEFLDLYREGGGTLALRPPERPEDEFHDGTESQESEQRDSVKLLTVHAAKGLEFKNVFVLRVVSQSFPTSFKETLFEFPRELAPAASVTDKTDEQIHKEEERRLFYVAMTRARDTLSLYGKLRGGKTTQEIPYGYLRELVEDVSLKSVLRVRAPHSAARSEHDNVLPHWISVAATRGRREIELSASAIETYSTCPLKFALQYRWRLPEEPSAALQYGAAMHSALRDFYDAAMKGVARSAEETVQIFLREFELAKIDEDLQRRLYERQGTEQLRQFVRLRQLEPQPNVLATEKSFRFAIEEVMIRGRIDRIDRLPEGGVLVLDYKTGAPRSDADAARSVQLGLYGMAARLEKLNVERLAFYNLEDQSLAETKRINEDKVHSTVLECASGISAGNFAPTPGFHCNHCGYYSLCPATAESTFAVPEKKLVAIGV